MGKENFAHTRAEKLSIIFLTSRGHIFSVFFFGKDLIYGKEKWELPIIEKIAMQENLGVFAYKLLSPIFLRREFRSQNGFAVTTGKNILKVCS